MRVTVNYCRYNSIVIRF